MNNNQRVLAAYEKNQLLKHGIDPADIGQYGEMPVEYITGQASFLGREFLVSPETLIPRVETEGLVNLIINDLKNIQSIKLADIGTGSGVIGLSLLAMLSQQGKDVEVVLADISPTALAIAQENYHQLFNKIDHQVTFLVSDLLQNFPQGKFDVLVANLPYIPSTRLNSLAASVKDYEPLLALDGGIDGLKYMRQFLSQAPEFLTPSGTIYLELDDSHDLEKLQAVAMGYTIKILLDEFGKNRMASLKIA